MNKNKMIYKIFIAVLMLNVCVFSQQAVLFKNPPGNLTLPSVLTEENGTPKTAGVAAIETKWVQSSAPSAESLLQTFTSSSDIGIRKIINDILTSANIPESKTSQLKINFTGSGIEERSIDKDAVVFSDDFAVKYTAESMFIITKLYRTKNVVIELTDGSSADFDPAVKDALSGGLRFGNKTETIQGNKMVIEIPHMIYAYEYVPITITRTVDKGMTLPLYMTSDFSLNSITSITLAEGAPYDFFVGVNSSAVPKPVEFRISNVNPKMNFRAGGREGYTLTYIEMGGNKVTFSISGFAVSFP
jgi:hypothetical protein